MLFQYEAERPNRSSARSRYNVHGGGLERESRLSIAECPGDENFARSKKKRLYWIWSGPALRLRVRRVLRLELPHRHCERPVDVADP